MPDVFQIGGGGAPSGPGSMPGPFGPSNPMANNPMANNAIPGASPAPLGAASSGVPHAGIVMNVYEGGDNELYDRIEGYENFNLRRAFRKAKGSIHNIFHHKHAAPVVAVFGNDSSGFDGEEPEEFLGIAIGKKARARKAEKFRIKMANKESRGYARKAKADARVILANQGINMGTAADSIASGLGSAANLVGSFMGGGNGASTAEQYPQQYPAAPAPAYSQTSPIYYPQETIGSAQAAGAYPADPFGPAASAGPDRYTEQNAVEKKSQNKMFLIIGAVVLVVVIAAMMMKRKK